MKSLVLRHITHMDFDAINSFVTNRNVTKFLTWEAYSDSAAVRKYIDKVIEKNAYPDETLGIEINGKLIGTIHIIARDNGNMQFGFGLLPLYWHQGIGSETVRMALVYIKESSWANHTKTIWADIHQKNIYAIKIVTKCGFLLEQNDIEPSRNRYTMRLN